MNTPATEDFSAIEWEQYRLMDYDTEERSQTWEMEGVGSDGKKYGGVGEYSCGELVAITQIELK